MEGAGERISVGAPTRYARAVSDYSNHDDDPGQHGPALVGQVPLDDPDPSAHAEYLDIDPSDEVESLDMGHEGSADASDSRIGARDGRSDLDTLTAGPAQDVRPRVEQVRRQPYDHARDEAPDNPVEASSASMSTISSVARIFAQTKGKEGAAFFNAYSGHLSESDKSEIKSLMIDNGIQFHDPEFKIMMLMGHMRAYANTIPSALDAKMRDIEMRFQEILGLARDVPEQIDQALAEARRLGNEMTNRQRDDADLFSARLGEGMREKVQEAFQLVDQAASARSLALKTDIEKMAGEQRASLEKYVMSAMGQIGGISMKVANEIAGMIKAKEQLSANQRHAGFPWWIVATCFGASAVAGFAAAIVAMKLFH